MVNFIQYVSQPERRERVIQGIGVFCVVGGLIVASILLAAKFLR